MSTTEARLDRIVEHETAVVADANIHRSLDGMHAKPLPIEQRNELRRKSAQKRRELTESRVALLRDLSRDIDPADILVGDLVAVYTLDAAGGLQHNYMGTVTAILVHSIELDNGNFIVSTNTFDPRWVLLHRPAPKLPTENLARIKVTEYRTTGGASAIPAEPLWAYLHRGSWYRLDLKSWDMLDNRSHTPIFGLKPDRVIDWEAV